MRAMDERTIQRLAADGMLLLHVLFVAFVVLGLLAILIGKLRSWSWVRNPWFRWAHIAAIGFVVSESWLGWMCPLTEWENALRAKAGDATYTGGFIAHWLDTILYYSAPEWVFTACYTAFGAVVLASWFWVRPRAFRRRRNERPGV